MVLKLSETVTNPRKTESYAEPEPSICKLWENVPRQTRLRETQ